MLKSLLVLLILSFASPVLAEGGSIQARMSFKSFRSWWFDSRKSALISADLVWREYGPELKDGFALDTAAQQLLVGLPAGCILDSFEGHLYGEPGDVSNLYFTLLGAACEEFVRNFGSAPLEIIFYDPRRQQTFERVGKLDLRID